MKNKRREAGAKLPPPPPSLEKNTFKKLSNRMCMIKCITISLNNHTLLYLENLCKVSTCNLQYFFVVPLTPAIQMLPCAFMSELDF